MKTNSAERFGDISRDSSMERDGRPLMRLAELFARRTTSSTSYRMAPPLRNPHYLGLHIAVASRTSIR